MIALVTGGTGFIGTNLIMRLLAEGHEVRVIDIAVPDGFRAAIKGHKVKVERADVCTLRRRAMDALCKDVHVIFHLAALGSVPRSIKRPMEVYKANVEGTLAVLERARKSTINRLIFASSSSVYGDTKVLPKHESMPAQPQSPYAASKLIGELYCQQYARHFAVPAVALRLFNVFGAHQRADVEYPALIPIWIRTLLQGKRCTAFGSLETSRDWTHVDNVVDAMLRVANVSADRVVGRVFNVGTGRRSSLRHVHRCLCAMLTRPYNIKCLPKRAGDVQHSLADISALREAVAYVPRVGFGTGLRMTLKWWKQQANAQTP